VRIDQWVPALHRGDAIGDSARLMRDAFRRWGHQADVWALELDADLLATAGASPTGSRGPQDVVLLHFALPSPLSAALARHPAGACCCTQHHAAGVLRALDAELARLCRVGREELARLAGQVELALADSEFNRRELEELGFARTGVLPIYLDFARYREKPSPVLRRMLDDGARTAVRRARGAQQVSRGPHPRGQLLAALQLSDVRLVLPGKLRPRAVLRRPAGLLLRAGLGPRRCCSSARRARRAAGLLRRVPRLPLDERARGFGVPLVESMLMDLPILAYRCTAVADTLGEPVCSSRPRTSSWWRAGPPPVARREPARAGAGWPAPAPAGLRPEAVEARLRAVVEEL